jgi:hypothetical protein
VYYRGDALLYALSNRNSGEPMKLRKSLFAAILLGVLVAFIPLTGCSSPTGPRLPTPDEDDEPNPDDDPSTGLAVQFWIAPGGAGPQHG